MKVGAIVFLILMFVFIAVKDGWEMKRPKHWKYVVK